MTQILRNQFPSEELHRLIVAMGDARGALPLTQRSIDRIITTLGLADVLIDFYEKTVETAIATSNAKLNPPIILGQQTPPVEIAKPARPSPELRRLAAQLREHEGLSFAYTVGLTLGRLRSIALHVASLEGVSLDDV